MDIFYRTGPAKLFSIELLRHRRRDHQTVNSAKLEGNGSLIRYEQNLLYVVLVVVISFFIKGHLKKVFAMSLNLISYFSWGLSFQDCFFGWPCINDNEEQERKKERKKEWNSSYENRNNEATKSLNKRMKALGGFTSSYFSPEAISFYLIFFRCVLASL